MLYYVILYYTILYYAISKLQYSISYKYDVSYYDIHINVCSGK